MKNISKYTAIIPILIGLNACSSSSKEDKSYASKLRIEAGGKIFNGKGNCASCHHSNDALVGPSLNVIASVYSKTGSMLDFFKQKSGPIVVPAQTDGMKANFTLLKSMSEEELLSLEAYILSSK